MTQIPADKGVLHLFAQLIFIHFGGEEMFLENRLKISVIREACRFNGDF